MLRQDVDSHHARVRQVVEAVEPGQWRHVGACSDVDEDLLRVELMLADTNLVWPREPRVSLVDGAVVHASEPALEPEVGFLHDRVLPCLHTPHVDANPAVDHDAEICGSAGDICGARACYQRLGRDTADVDTRAAEQVTFDDRHLPPRAGQLGRKTGPGLPGTDHDRVI